MIRNNSKLGIYLNSIVNSVFKILPLYEEQNVGVATYVESLIFELDGLQDIIAIEHSYEYISLLSTLASVRKEVEREGSKKTVIKREVFKCINIIKNMAGKLEEGE
jgi:hypothetical protein